MSLDALIAQLAVAQPRDGVVLVEALLRLGRRFDMPLDQRRAERLRNLEREHGLAGAGLAFNQQGPLQRDGGIDGDGKVAGRDVAGRPLEASGTVVRRAGLCHGPDNLSLRVTISVLGGQPLWGKDGKWAQDRNGPLLRPREV